MISRYFICFIAVVLVLVLHVIRSNVDLRPYDIYGNTAGTRSLAYRGAAGFPNFTYIYRVYHNAVEIVHNITFENIWKTVVQTPEVSQFRADYLKDCNLHNGTYTVDIEDGKRHNVSTKLQESRGLASALNTVLSCFLLSRIVSPPKRFYLVAKTWNYGDFRDTFVDFSDNTTCQITNFPTIRSYRGTKLTLTKGVVTFHGQHALFEMSILPTQKDHYDAFRSVPGLIGVSKYFDTKSRMARAFLVPHPDILKIIRKLWTELTATSGHYGFIHIRRGDKKKEATPVSVSNYQERYKAECNKIAAYPRTIYLMCDGKNACDEFKNSMGAGYRLTDYRSMVSPGNNRTESGLEAEHSQPKFDSLPLSVRKGQTTELVVSIYLAALSDLIVCTYSSNVCRLIALLRGGVVDKNGIHSVDTPNWYGAR